MEKLNRIKDILVEQRRTQTWLAEQLGFSQEYVNRICNNKNQPLVVDLKRIAVILDVDIRDLLVSTKK